MEQLFDRKLPGARAAGIARTKWIDDEVTQALETSTHLVLLGAGFDTRAYRLPAAQRVRTFDLDHPGTSSAKQAALREIERYLAARKLRLVQDLSVAEVWLRAGRPGSDVRGYEFYRLASACVPAYTQGIP